MQNLKAMVVHRGRVGKSKGLALWRCRRRTSLASHRARRSPGAAAVGRLATPDVAQVLAASAAFTRSGVSGYWRSRTLVASKNALARAAAVAPITSSPAPVE